MASLVATSRITLQYLWSLCCWLCYSCTLYCNCCILLGIKLLLLLLLQHASNDFYCCSCLQPRRWIRISPFRTAHTWNGLRAGNSDRIASRIACSYRMCRGQTQSINRWVANMYKYCKISNIRHTKSPNLIVSRLVVQLSLSNPMKPGVTSREWRCSWSSADRRCSNYIWVIDNFIAC